jgi:hypothetical protein
MMKQLLLQLSLFFLPFFFTLTVLGQTPPDPGKDPLPTTDSVMQTAGKRTLVSNRTDVNDISATEIPPRPSAKLLSYSQGYIRKKNPVNPL